MTKSTRRTNQPSSPRVSNSTSAPSSSSPGTGEADATEDRDFATADADSDTWGESSRMAEDETTGADEADGTDESDEATADKYDAERLLDLTISAMGGTRREGQVTMAKEVQKAIRIERHLAVQAGTGTGKSMAYLVPAIAHAVETNTTIVVSTATIALQRQLISRDLPRLAAALEPELGEIRFSIMKGRSNYLCLNKVGVSDNLEDGLIDAADLSEKEREVAKIREWAQVTEDGDRDHLDHAVPDLVWNALSVTAKECIGAKACAYGEQCFAERARAQSADAHVIVTNHALLAIDALSEGRVLPEHSVVIIDEAHELDARITSVATAELYGPGMSATAKRVAKFDKELSADLQESIDHWTDYVAAQPEGSWTPLPSGCLEQLQVLRTDLSRASAVVRAADPDALQNDPEKAAERQAVMAALDELDMTCQRLEDFQVDAAAGTTPDDVVWKEGGSRQRVLVAPLSVSEMLATRLFAENTVILTSATLALGGRFDAMAARWGLRKNSYTAMDVGSPFKAQSSGILYVAKDLPAPGRDGTAPETVEQMKELITAAGGRTLGLFSSRRAAEAAAAELRSTLPFEVYCQGEDSIGALVQRFSANENSVLLGTLTLWQGVDVPGSSLSLVIIDRIPFPRPDDPLIKARTKAADQAGRNGFMEVSASHAALLMAQGAGRLLRSVTDRGVVAVLDPRLITKRYGSFIIRSMPPFWATTSLEQTCGALRRLVDNSHTD